MLILALDTTTRGGSVAITRDDTLLALVKGDATRTHGERVPGEMARALAEAGVRASALDLLAVASGPGAFTGLRIGLAAMQGLAMALDRPVAGVPTLQALAWISDDIDASGAADDADDTDGVGRHRFVVPWMDGQRGDVFAAIYAVMAGMPPDQWRPWPVVEDATADKPAALLERWRTTLKESRAVFIGDAVERDRAVIDRVGAGQWRCRTPGPLAPAIARIGRRLAPAGLAGRPHALAPVYARRPDAEIERDRRGVP